MSGHGPRTRLRRAAAVAVCLTLAAGLLGACKRAPDVKHYLRDDAGRALILHGMNVAGSAKSTPSRIPDNFTAADAARLGRDWGLNEVRYLVMWDAIEPQPGVYDEGYLDAVAAQVRLLQANGVSVILDVHQDIYTRRFGGDGAPEWAVRTDGLPVTPQEPWWTTCVQPGALAAYWHFWHDPDLRPHYVAAVRHLAARLAHEPGVLGIDPMNEPFGGLDTIGDYFGWEAQLLTPLYGQLVEAIRSVAPDTWIFLEPSSFGVNAGVPSGLQPPHDPRPAGSRLVYFPHLYPIDLETGATYTGDTGMLDFWASTRSDELDRLGWPGAVGEVGWWGGGDAQRRYMRDAFATADRVGSGWTWWAWDDIGPLRPDGSEKPEVNGLVQVYARAVAGDPIDWSWDETGRTFHLRFRPDPAISAPTELSVPPRWFPDGFRVSLDTDAAHWSSTFDATQRILSVRTDVAAGSIVTLTVTPVSRPSPLSS